MKGKLRWAEHAMRSQNSLTRVVLEQNPKGERPSGRLKMRWENIVKTNVEALGVESNWKDLAMDRWLKKLL